MRSMSEIMSSITDGKINTKEEAATLVAEEAAAAAVFYKIPVEIAAANILSNIGYWTGYLDHATADKIMDLFDCEHPIFGRTHPTAEEALRIGMEYGERRRREKSK
jgi:hypothetical protein